MKKMLLLSFCLASCGTPFSRKFPGGGERGNGNTQPPSTENGEPSRVMEVYPIIATPYNVDLGRGIDTKVGLMSTMAHKGRCVKVLKQNTINNTSGATTKISVDVIKNNSDLYKKSTIDFSSKFGVGDSTDLLPKLLNFSISASINGFSDIRVNSSNSYFMVTSEKYFSPINITEYAIDEGLIANFEAYPEDFAKTCGDGFVSTVVMGAKITGLLVCQNEDVDTKQTTDMTMDAAMKGYYSGETHVKAGLEKILKEKRSNCRMVIEASGGSGALPNSMTAEDFVQKSIEYINGATFETAQPISIGTLPYTSIGDNVKFSKIRHTIQDAIEYNSSLITMNKLALESKIARLDGLEWLYFANKGDEKWRKEKGEAVQQQIREQGMEIIGLTQKIFKCSNELSNKKVCIAQFNEGGSTGPDVPWPDAFKGGGDVQ